jgi:hypothetical protein
MVDKIDIIDSRQYLFLSTIKRTNSRQFECLSTVYFVYYYPKQLIIKELNRRHVLGRVYDRRAPEAA